MNDNSLATTSMMSTTSQFSSPIESTEISDWSKAERLTFVPANGHSPSMAESFCVNLTKVPPPPPPPPLLPPGQFPYQQSFLHHDGDGRMIQSYANGSCPPNAQYYPAQNAHQTLPTQSQWMQNILAQNRTNWQKPTGIGGMRSYWEQRIREETMEKQREELTKSRLSLGPKRFLFPRWRSVDPMTASLVASARTTELLPGDSRIPEYRQEKLVQTERMAQMDKFELHKPYIQMAIYKQHQRRGRSLLAPRQPYDPEEMARKRTMALYDESTGQWYDPEKIRQAVSHESIANVGATRQMWEQTSWQEMAKSEYEREQERQQHFAQQQYWQ